MMMKRAQIVLSFLAAFLLATTAFADAGDAGMSDMGFVDAGTADMGSDVGMADMGTTDTGTTDMGTDVGSVDMGSSDMDTTGDAGAVVDAGPRSFTVSGTAVLSTSEAATIEVVLMPAGGTPQTDFTDAAGRFEFRDLSQGTYDVTVSYPGYVAQSRSIELAGDRRLDFVLFPDVTFTVVVDVTFVDGTGPMTATARSLGREVVAEGDGPGELEMMLGAGPWDVAVEAPGYLSTNLAFNLAADRDPAEPVRLSAVLERPASPEITSDAGCSCSHGEPQPDGAVILLLVAAGLVGIRRRIR